MNPSRRKMSTRASYGSPFVTVSRADSARSDHSFQQNRRVDGQGRHPHPRGHARRGPRVPAGRRCPARAENAAPARRRRGAGPVRRRRGRRSSRLDGGADPAHPRRLVHPLLRRASALDQDPESVAVGLGLLAIPGWSSRRSWPARSPRSPSTSRISTGLLIGAVLAPTDPAILIPLFARIGIRQKIEQTAIAESALNDATGAVLALVSPGSYSPGMRRSTGPPVDFLQDLAIATALGIGFGIVLARRLRSPRGSVA